MYEGHIYLDSSYFGDFINDDDPDSKRYAVNIKNRLSSLHRETIIPQIVVGEIISSVIGKRKFDDINDITNRIKIMVQEVMYFINPEICMPPIKSEVISHFQYLHDKCKVDATDAFILAYAIHDPKSEYFITKDPKMLHNKAIKNYEEQLRDDEKRTIKLIITDNP
jgi:predicted nucleic acid-binding protein